VQQQRKEQQHLPSKLMHLLGQKRSSPAAADALASAQVLRQQALSNLGLQGLASVMKKAAGGSTSSPGADENALPGSAGQNGPEGLQHQEKLAPVAVAVQAQRQQLPQQQQQQPGSGGKDTFSSFYSAMGDSIKKRFQQEKQSAAAAAGTAAAGEEADFMVVGPTAVKKPKLSRSKPAH
jgi:hypothetical protein